VQTWGKTACFFISNSFGLKNAYSIFFQHKLWYYKGNYSMFKKMVVQKRRELLKDFEKQEKRLKELKSQGQSKKKAEGKAKEALTRKQQKNQVSLLDLQWPIG
jgi:ATP-binding cassette subfamily F protein 1